MTYTAPIRSIMFALQEIAGIEEISALPGHADLTPDLVRSVLEEAGRFTAGVLAPLNRNADQQGSRLENGVVRTPDGFKEAYAQFVAGGWNGVPFDPEFGGQGLPWVLSAAIQEMVTSSCMSFSLCPLLTQGAVELLLSHGTGPQKQMYLTHLVSGRWTGTMNLTEPQAGSDVGALRTRAVRDGDRYRITGQKVFITFGEHDMAENIVHMVLARTPEAPPGIKGISLFIVPKYLVLPDGTLDGRNDLRCVSLEHKLGIRGSPTAVMVYGDNGGAVGELVGEENRGIEYMFTMMNIARLSVGIEGLAIAERAYQQARDYAKTRIQGRAADGNTTTPVPIIAHPDVKRTLMSMRAQIEAMRALVVFTAGSLDRAKQHPDARERERHQELVDLLTPVVKAWCTDTGCALTSSAIQIHGGLGFVESTGAAQHYRDARIAPIYEGTNGIQAVDLVGRKLARDGGAAARTFIATMRGTVDAMLHHEDRALQGIAARLADSINDLARSTERIVRQWGTDRPRALAGATPYLNLFGTVAGGWLLARLAVAAVRRRPGSDRFEEALPPLGLFYADNHLSQTAGMAHAVCDGGAALDAMRDDHF